MAQRKNSGRTFKRTNPNENTNPSATKRGPGRYHRGGEPGAKLSKERPVRAFQALLNAWAAKRIPKWSGPRDEHGAYTPIGAVNEYENIVPDSRDHVLSAWVPAYAGDGGGFTARRKWLAGISERRGY